MPAVGRIPITRVELNLGDLVAGNMAELVNVLTEGILGDDEVVRVVDVGGTIRGHAVRADA